MKAPNPLHLVKFESDKLLLFTDLAGTLLLGVAGGNQAISGNLDFLGVMVLPLRRRWPAASSAICSIGAVPPDSLQYGKNQNEAAA